MICINNYLMIPIMISSLWGLIGFIFLIKEYI